MIGQLDILNVMEGEVKITFDQNNPGDMARARHVIEDMLKRGYALLVEIPDGQIVRAEGFDPDTNSYLVASWPAPSGESDDTTTAPKPTASRKKQINKVPIDRVRATGVARSAGG